MARDIYVKRLLSRAIAGAVAVSGLLLSPIAPVAPATALPASSDFTITTADLTFILKNIQISEAHATKEPTTGWTGLNPVPPTSEYQPGSTRAVDIPSAGLPWGLRQVDGRNNNFATQFSTWTGGGYAPSAYGDHSAFGATDRMFPRLATEHWMATADNPGLHIWAEAARCGTDTVNGSYATGGATLCDTTPRTISNLIADQSTANPAAEPYGRASVVGGKSYGGSIAPPYGGTGLDIPNSAPVNGLPPYSSMFSFFGQFFDHGLDLVGKTNTVVALPVTDPADPLYASSSSTPMMLARTDRTGDNTGSFTTGTNRTTPWVDQNQTYASIPSKQVLMRAYEVVGGAVVPTGGFLHEANGNIATWATVKKQALEVLGIRLVDNDIFNVPLILTDEYGRFLRGPARGLPLLVTAVDANGVVTAVAEGDLATPVAAASGVHTGHAFLDDIAHTAVPSPDGPDPDSNAGNSPGSGKYDDELLDAHFITGDGRGNENIGLTAIHAVFEMEHQRLVEDINRLIGADTASALYAGFHAPGWSYGDRLFQAARFVNEMEYQHLVFDTFVRRIEPGIGAFVGYNPAINPDIVTEFSNAVYRLGHSQLNETLQRVDATGTDQSLPLFDAFLNPLAFNTLGSSKVNADVAAGAIARGASQQVGNEIDEFVTNVLRNNLVGIPLDLASLNIARGRDVGLPTLNGFREQFASTNPELAPYTSWVDFGANLRHEESLVNFVAAYGRDQYLTDQTTDRARRCAAYFLVNGTTAPDTYACSAAGVGLVDTHKPNDADRRAFMTSDSTGLQDVDLWIGGLAESRGIGASLLGSTFSYVFRTQLERLQNGDRLYYLSRLAGTNLLNQVANNTLADIFVRNTDVANLPADMFSAPGVTVDMSTTSGGIGSGSKVTWYEPNLSVHTATFTGSSVPLSLNSGSTQGSVEATTESNALLRSLWYKGTLANGIHAVFIGSPNADRMKGGAYDDTLRGFANDDVIDGWTGNDNLQGGDGDDTLRDSGTSGADLVLGGAGRDFISSGGGADVNDGGTGDDFVEAGANGPVVNGGLGNDLLYGGVAADSLTGDEGDDWIQGGASAGDLLEGDLVVPALGIDQVQPGADVLVVPSAGLAVLGMAGAEDVALGGDAARNGAPSTIIGGLAFDWASYLNATGGVDVDLSLVAADPANVRHLRMDLFPDGDVEGLSGSQHNDLLAGDNRLQLTNGLGGDDRLDLANARVAGLAALIDASVIANGVTGRSGNILLGGDGSDRLTGYAGNDYLDGDAYLSVNLTGCSNTWSAINTTLRDLIAGTCRGSGVTITRSVLANAGAAGTDVAVFSGTSSQYTVRPVTNGPSTYYVVTGPDGVDVVRNIEQLTFADVTVAPSAMPVTVRPSDPLNVTPSPLNGAARVAWDQPATTGGRIDSYTATAWNSPSKGKQVGSCTVQTSVTAARSCTIGGLANGTAYYVDVVAQNALGAGVASAPRMQVIPSALPPTPSAPRLVLAPAGDTQTVVSWAAPTSTGTTAITSYTAQAFSAATNGFVMSACTTPDGATLSCPLTGLTNGTTYYVEVWATNASGAGVASSPRVAVTPVAPTPTPSAPQNVTATSGNAGSAVTWQVPLSTGTSAVIDYTATAWTAATGGTLVSSCTTATLTCTIGSLTNGTTYYVDVTARNGTGSGAASTPRVAVTPSAPVVLAAPATPTGVSTVGGTGVMTVTWSASARATSYQARAYLKRSGGQAVGTCTTTLLSCQITVAAGTYYVDVVAINSGGTSAASTRVQVIVR